MITFLILIAPLPLLMLYGVVRMRLKRSRQLAAEMQVPAPHEEPYEPTARSQPNAFLRLFPLTTQLYLRQQWILACTGFVLCLWMFTVLLCRSLVPPFEVKLPSADQQVWLSFVAGASLWSLGLPAFIAILAAMIAGGGITSSAAVFPRTRPIPLRVIFWGRILPALAALLLAAALSIGLAFSALRIAYGPVWRSVSSTSAAASGAVQLGLTHPNDCGTAGKSCADRLRWLAQNPTPGILASSMTTMTLSFSVSILIFCQRSGANTNFPSGKIKWITPIVVGGLIFAWHRLTDSAPGRPSLGNLSHLFFYNLPLQSPPPWRFLPVPIVLSIALLFLSERLYSGRRDI